MKNLNKKWVSLIDTIIAMSILSLLTLLYFWWLQAYYKYSERIERVNYTNFALIECAEVIHSIRYGEIDRNWSSGWNVYSANHPTWLYKINYDETINAWGIEPILKNEATWENFLSFRDMMEDVWYTAETEWENFLVWPPQDKVEMRRYVFINNNNPEKSNISCYARYLDDTRFMESAENDFFNYIQLNFTMTDY